MGALLLAMTLLQAKAPTQQQQQQQQQVLPHQFLNSSQVWRDPSPTHPHPPQGTPPF